MVAFHNTQASALHILDMAVFGGFPGYYDFEDANGDKPNNSGTRIKKAQPGGQYTGLSAGGKDEEIGEILESELRDVNVWHSKFQS
ncbi:hypothetical protein CVT24_002444 [Panaeolus cyanescens]|uniref:Uncharacterized protein n=1 Tax=Panaeolus cyanescens TaxID=181874 RepID=A0A409WVF8_9AGAR|nr:hypothetical protein CVT24_002444 [Panaeolus cyanescens]